MAGRFRPLSSSKPAVRHTTRRKGSRVPSYRRPRRPVSGAVAESQLTAAALPLFLLASLSACEGERQPAAGDSSGDIALGAADVHVIGTSDAIARVQDLMVLADGTVWILNSVEPLLVGFAADGSILRAHGRSGGGPEEFGRPAGFVVGGIEGDPWLFDWQRHTLWTTCGSRNDSTPTGSLRSGYGACSATSSTSHRSPGSRLHPLDRAGAPLLPHPSSPNFRIRKPPPMLCSCDCAGGETGGGHSPAAAWSIAGTHPSSISYARSG